MNQDELELLYEARQILESPADHVDELICECECVSIKDIRGFFNQDNIDLEAIRARFNLGAGCSSCLKSFEVWKNKI